MLVEVKAADSLSTQDEGQLLNYLKASKIRRGVLIDFGAPTLQYKRRVWVTSRPAAHPWHRVL